MFKERFIVLESAENSWRYAIHAYSIFKLESNDNNSCMVYFRVPDNGNSTSIESIKAKGSLEQIAEKITALL